MKRYFLMFSIADRDRVRERVLSIASANPDVVGAAILGSMADGEGDKWSHLDLMLAVSEPVPMTEVLDSLSEDMVREFDAVRLFDLPTGAIVYRVFLLPDSLELDLSVTPESAFGAGGPNFRVLFGETVDLPDTPPSPSDELLGYAVHHALHARACIERGRYWQAEYWISAVRDYALNLACQRRGPDGWYGRDFDRLPAEVLDPFGDAIVRRLDRDDLKQALASAVSGLLREATGITEMVERVRRQLAEISSDS